MEKLTPLMQQYWDIKKQHPDKVLFYRMGDFFELFFDDARLAAPLLGLTLTYRNKKQGDHTPMCGLPHHAIAGPVNKLLSHGFKVAICDQLEDPALAKGLVKRGVTRILTPGMVFDPETLDQTKAHYMAAYHAGELALWDTSTGEAFYFEKVSSEQIRQVSQDFPIAEWVLVEANAGNFAFLQPLSLVAASSQAQETARDLLLRYVKSLVTSDTELNWPTFHKRSFQTRWKMNPQALRHLEVFESYSGERGDSLFAVVNKTLTPMGARRLRYQLAWPTTDRMWLEAQKKEIHFWVTHWRVTEQAMEILRHIGDLERRLARVSQAQSHARDLRQLLLSLDYAFKLYDLCQVSERIAELSNISKLRELARELDRSLLPDPPQSIRQGFMIATGVDPELDEWIELSTHAQQKLFELEEKEKARTGISSLKIRYNQVFGYYVEITHTHKDKVPTDYQRKQTLAQAERFTFPELLELERKILAAETERFEREYQIFLQLKNRLLSFSSTIRSLAQQVAAWDVAIAAARLVVEEAYSLPEWSEGEEIRLESSRHPVVEKRCSRFVANDVHLGRSEMMLLTGPNMAGKSTLMRQVALNALLAHAGLPVACAQGFFPVLDGLFTRIGASDRLAEGLSTFMVEMQETSQMIHHYGPRSLVILDEIGRGTSTYDGMSLAQALVEYFLNKKWGFILFATHYHELCELAQAYPGQLKNYHMRIREITESGLEFLHRLSEGPAGKSYGLHVAKLAGIPDKIIKRATALLKTWESSSGPSKQPSLWDFIDTNTQLDAQNDANSCQEASWQEDFFAQEVLPTLQGNINELTPMAALNLLFSWQQKWLELRRLHSNTSDNYSLEL